MKKLNKLFAILIAVLGAGTLSAQTDVTSTYLTNAGFDDTSGWATSNVAVTSGGNMQAVPGWNHTLVGWSSSSTFGYGGGGAVNGSSVPTTGPDGTANGGAFGFSGSWSADIIYTQALTLQAGVYTFTYNVYNAQTSTDANNKIETNKFGFVASSGATYYGTTTTFTPSTWTEVSTTFALTAATSGSISVGAKFPQASSNVTPRLIIDGVTLTHKPFIDVTESNSVDLTSMGSGNWTGQSGSTNAGGVTSVPERWQGSSYEASTTPLSKTITNLPAGVYTIEIYCASSSTSNRDSGVTAVTDGDTKYLTLSVNDSEQDIPSYNRTSISGNLPYYTFNNIKITEGNIDIKYNINEKGPNWLLAKVKSITYLGPDKSLEEANFATNITNLNALSTNNVPTAFVTKIYDLKSTYGSADAVSMTLSELIAANGEIKAIVDTHPTLVTSYADITDFITLCESYSTNSIPQTTDKQEAFNQAISDAETAANAASSVAEITAAHNTLETACQTYTMNAYPTNDFTFDISYKMTTTWANGGNNYTAAGIVMKERYTKAPYTGTVMSTTISDLPNGIYDVEVYCNANAAMHDGTWEFTDGAELTSVHANDVSVKIPVKITKGNDYANVITLTDVVVKDNKVDIKIVNDQEAANWVVVAHKSLTLKSADITGLQASVTELKTEAQGISGKMNSEVQTNLANAISSADATATNPYTLEAMIADLQEGIDAANTAIRAYESLNKAIEMTKAFVDASELTSYETMYSNNTNSAAEVETARQELNVMRFNAASAVFTNKIEVADWVGTMGTRSDQHWSGNTISYYDANSWGDLTPDALTKEIALTKGTYVLKVAGRTHANATLTLEVLDQVITFHSKGDEGYGITKAGNACFSPDSTYANDNKGRGWEWEFLKFELDTDQTVELKVNSNYNNIWQVWTSFGDITLWMDDATYVTVYGDAVNAPLAEARTLVNTLPMGDAENTALANAIELGEGTIETPAQLNAAVDALKAAVANANAWRSTYYTEKGKLVAALERFEADYNDAENGALDYMNKERWATAIAKAQAAAVAKDDLTSHANLTTATTKLTAALDAATVSVGEYADLKDAITEATTVTSANVGVNAFQKSQSAATTLNEQKATAQGVYETATADGEGVTSETETLTNAISTFNNTPLNAPKENARYNIVVETTDDWGGHAATFIYDEENKAEDGYFNLQWLTEPSANYAQAFTFTASSELNTYTLSFVDHLGTTRYLATQKGAGYMDGENVSNRTDRLRITDDANKALKVQVIALNTDGLYQLKNTEHGQCIGYTTNHDLFTQTRNVSLKEAEKANVTLTLSSVGWATLILPFDADLPSGVKAYSCEEINGEEIILQENNSIKANTPYLMNGSENTYTFSGYGLADKDSYTDGLFVGTYVDYQTTADGKTYVLQNNNGNLAFYLVTDAAQPWIRANRCYMTYEATEGEAAPMFILSRGEDTTGIETTINAQPSTVIYDLMGRKVTTMMKGGMYIVNGKKVVIR